MQLARWIFVLVAIWSLHGLAVAAPPSHKTPEGTLDVRPDPINQGLNKRVIELYGQIEPVVAQASAAAKNQNWKRLKVKQLNDTSMKMLELERNAWWLKMRGEPAGIDFTLRLADLREQLNAVLVEFRKAKEAGQQIEALHGVLIKEAKTSVKSVPKIESLIEQKKFEQAEKDLFVMTDPLLASTIWFEGNPAAKEMAVIQPPMQTVQSEMNKIRVAHAEETLVKAREKLAPDCDELLKSVAAAAEAVKTSGKAEFEGEQLRGPELAAKFGALWQATHLATMQCVGFEWARGKAAGAAGSGDLDQLLDRYRNFSLQMTTNLGKLIDADASRVPAAEARQLYFEYLQSLAPFVSLAADPKVSESLDGPLKAVAAKDPALATQVEGYGKVMGDLLRWRGRTARALARKQDADYPPLADQCRTALRTSEERMGLVHDDAQEVVMVLKTSVPKVMPQVLKLMEQDVSIGNWVGLTGSQPLSISQLKHRTCAMMTRPSQLADETAALERDLQVSETAPPMTLEAAMAVATAKRGDLVSVGGKVTGVYLESMTNRFAMLKEAVRNLLPLGPLADVSNVGPAPLPNVLLRFDIDPAWVCHSYFFIPLK